MDLIMFPIGTFLLGASFTMLMTGRLMRRWHMVPITKETGEAICEAGLYHPTTIPPETFRAVFGAHPELKEQYPSLMRHLK